ncbi:hypothetical protein [Streptomyces sp. NPDC058279]|uniref:hypothetical protein n=1 Tax=Streptomyces sp. NPDC058279 TaxID=3346418 RepID=UPI0036EAFDF9
MVASALEVTAATLSNIARNAPKGGQPAVGQAANVLASKLAGLVGKNIATSAGTFRISLGRVIDGAKCISFAQIATGKGREQPNVQRGNDCVPPPNDPNWHPPDKCFLGHRQNQQPPNEEHQNQQPPNEEHQNQQPPNEEHQNQQPPNEEHQNQQPGNDQSSTTSTG